jgi:hypothetical protein
VRRRLADRLQRVAARFQREIGLWRIEHGSSSQAKDMVAALPVQCRSR